MVRFNSYRAPSFQKKDKLGKKNILKGIPNRIINVED